MNAIRLTLFIISLILTSNSINAKEAIERGDTLIIVFEKNSINKVREIIKKINSPELKYPNDCERMFEIWQYEYCDSCTVKLKKKNNFNFWFRYVPKAAGLKIEHGNYFYLKRESLINYKLLDDNWFNHTDWEEVLEFLRENSDNLFLIDKSFVHNEKFIALKVQHYDWTDTGH